MFEGFALRRVDVGEAELRVRYGGSGPGPVQRMAASGPGRLP